MRTSFELSSVFARGGGGGGGGRATTIYAGTGGCAILGCLFSKFKFWGFIIGKLTSSHKFWGVMLEK